MSSAATRAGAAWLALTGARTQAPDDRAAPTMASRLTTSGPAGTRTDLAWEATTTSSRLRGSAPSWRGCSVRPTRTRRYPPAVSTAPAGGSPRTSPCLARSRCGTLSTTSCSMPAAISATTPMPCPRPAGTFGPRLRRRGLAGWLGVGRGSLTSVRTGCRPRSGRLRSRQRSVAPHHRGPGRSPRGRTRHPSVEFDASGCRRPPPTTVASSTRDHLT